MDTRRPVDGAAVAWMTTLCAVWASQQVLLKATAGDIAPTWQIAMRSAASVLLVVAFMRWRAEPLPGRGSPWGPGALAGALFGVEFLLLGEALRLTSASHATVLLYTSPIFAALGLHWRLPSERLRPSQWAGIGLAFAGIAWAFLSRAPVTGGAAPTATLLGDGLALAAGAAWGATTVVVRCSRLASTPASETLLYQLVGAVIVTGAVAIAAGQTAIDPTPLALGGLAYQALIGAFASYLAWFWLLTRYRATQLGVFTFMTPLFAVALGAWLLGEPLEPAFLQGAAAVIAGIVLVSRRP